MQSLAVLEWLLSALFMKQSHMFKHPLMSRWHSAAKDNTVWDKMHLCSWWKVVIILIFVSLVKVILTASSIPPSPLPQLLKGSFGDGNKPLKFDSELWKKLKNMRETSEESQGSLARGRPVEVIDMWLSAQQNLQELVDSQFPRYLPLLLEIAAESNISMECSEAFLRLLFGVRELKSWAVRGVDSWGKPLAGILEGSIGMLGHYDQCLSINVPTQGSDHTPYFRGQYCMIHGRAKVPSKPKPLTIYTNLLNFTNTKAEGKFLEYAMKELGTALSSRKLRYGICVPSACSPSEIQRIVDTVMKNVHIVTFEVTHCELDESPKWEPYQIFIASIFAILVAFLIIGSAIDYADDFVVRYGKNTLKCFRDFFRCFSVRINSKEVLKTNSQPGDIGVLHGIRVISMTWLIYSHTYLLPVREVFRDGRPYVNAVKGLIFQGIMNGFLIVDTFFFMSALLFTYTAMRKLDNSKGRFNIPQTIFNRIYRLFFPMAFSVIFVFIWLNLGRGPMWKEVIGWQFERCQRSWWATMLFFSNFIPNKDICLEHTWYLGADMQLFIFFIPVLLILYKWQKTGMSLLFVLACLGAFSSAITVYVTGLPPVPLYSYAKEVDIFEVIHVVHLWPNFHVVTFAIGTLLGLMLYKKRDNVTIPRTIRYIGWIVALCFALMVIWMSYFWNNNELKSPAFFAFFAAFQRVAWCFSLGWTIYLCATGNGGSVNKFLSAKIFLPLSRLTFVVYIIHQLIIWTRDGIKPAGLFFSHYTMFCEFVVNAVLAFSLAFVFHLAIEAPFTQIHKRYLTKIFKGAEIVITKHTDEMNVTKDNVSTKL